MKEGYFPFQSEYAALFRPGVISPLWTVLPFHYVTVPQIFTCLEDDPYPFLLESVKGKGRNSRYSFLGASPYLRMVSRGGKTTVERQGGHEEFATPPFQLLTEELSKWKTEVGRELPPFWGGGVGYFSYDFGHYFENLFQPPADDLQLPEMVFAFYDQVIAVDHAAHLLYVIASPLGEDDLWQAYRQASSKLERLLDKLGSLWKGKPSMPRAAQPASSHATAQTAVPFTSNYSQRDFERMVVKAKSYIREGDVFQVNLSHRIETACPISGWDLYQALRRANPAPFFAYLPCDDFSVVSSSPERLVTVRGRQVEALPIAGTYPRGRDAFSDRMGPQELMMSEKDRAEHLMLVDLARNDLGRVCQYGSVQVPHLSRVEPYETVFHLVSKVTGILPPEIPSYQLFPAMFPGGTITGAPKIRAMQIIDELENVRRGIYTGSLGYFCFDGHLDFNILIRTFVVTKGRAFIQVGAGIVADSDPTKEYLETLYKAKGLIRAIQQDEQRENVLLS